MGCCSCFKFLSKPQRWMKSICGPGNRFSRQFFLSDNTRHVDRVPYNSEAADILCGSDDKLRCHDKDSEPVLLLSARSGIMCKKVPVKQTRHAILSEDENGNKMVNEYVREYKIGSGSYGKVAVYRSSRDGNRYAIKAFHKSHLLKLRVAPSETAMTDVLKEVSIMEMLDHPNIVNLTEVIDDPNADHLYLVLEYVEGKCTCEDSGAPGGIGEMTARRYLRDIVSGLMYLHAHNIVHGDIKPDNLLVTSSGVVKIGDFSVSQVFKWEHASRPSSKAGTHDFTRSCVMDDTDAGVQEKIVRIIAYLILYMKRKDNNDELRRSPGTPAFTAPECCLGLAYHGKAADTWALGVTLYFLVLGQYPFLGDTLQETYDKIVNNPLSIPEGINPQLKDLLQGLLCKDPKQRIVLQAIAMHPWVVEEGPLPQYLCWCKRR